MEISHVIEPQMVEGTWQRLQHAVMGIPEGTDVLILQRRGPEEALCKVRTGGAAWITVKDLTAPRIERVKESEETVRYELGKVKRRLHHQ